MTSRFAGTQDAHADVGSPSLSSLNVRCHHRVDFDLVRIYRLNGDCVWPANISSAPAVPGHLSVKKVLGMPAWVGSDNENISTALPVDIPKAFAFVVRGVASVAERYDERPIGSCGAVLLAMAEAPAVDSEEHPLIDLGSVGTPPTPPRPSSRFWEWESSCVVSSGATRHPQDSKVITALCLVTSPPRSTSAAPAPKSEEGVCKLREITGVA